MTLAAVSGGCGVGGRVLVVALLVVLLLLLLEVHLVTVSVVLLHKMYCNPKVESIDAATVTCNCGQQVAWDPLGIL